MLSIPQHTELSVVFTAAFAGVYTFVFSPADGAIDFALNDEGITPHYSSGADQASFTVLMQAEDELSHNGPAAALSGFRIGDELSE